MISKQRGGSGELPLMRRVFTLNLSMLTLIGIGAATLIAIVWVFALGIIVGRGLSPEDTMPILGRIVNPPAEPVVEENPEVIRPEDLDFFTELKTPPISSMDEPPVRAPSPSQAPVPDYAVQAQRTENRTPAVQTGEQTPEAVKSHSSSNERFNYVFQVVAYKKPEQADTFRDKLEQAGLRTKLSIDRDSRGKARFYRIQVLVHGTDEDAENAKAILAQHGIKDPFLASRKPAGR